MGYLNDFKRMVGSRELPCLTEASDAALRKQVSAVLDTVKPSNAALRDPYGASRTPLFVAVVDGVKARPELMAHLSKSADSQSAFEKSVADLFQEPFEAWFKKHIAGVAVRQKDYKNLERSSYLVLDLLHAVRSSQPTRPEVAAAPEPVKSSGIGSGKHTYSATYKGKKYDVHANTRLRARDTLASYLNIPAGPSYADIEVTEADMGKAIPGEKLLGRGKPMKGKVMNPENRAALEKLLWGWQTEAVLQCLDCGKRFPAGAKKCDDCEDGGRVKAQWPISEIDPAGSGRAAHAEALRKAGWVSSGDQPDAFKVGDKVLRSLDNGYEEMATIKGFFKNGALKLKGHDGRSIPSGEHGWKKKSDIGESALADLRAMLELDEALAEPIFEDYALVSDVTEDEWVGELRALGATEEEVEVALDFLMSEARDLEEAIPLVAIGLAKGAAVAAKAAPVVAKGAVLAAKGASKYVAQTALGKSARKVAKKVAATKAFKKAKKFLASTRAGKFLAKKFGKKKTKLKPGEKMVFGRVVKAGKGAAQKPSKRSRK